MEKCLLIRIGLASLLVMTALAGSAIAGGTQAGFEPPEGSVVSGPELWGVAMLYCNVGGGSFATLRLKRVVDCNTETLTWVQPGWLYSNCPETAEAATLLEGDFMQERLGAWFPSGQTPGTPYIETVKNFVREEDSATGGWVISFDAMFKFYSQ